MIRARILSERVGRMIEVENVAIGGWVKFQSATGHFGAGSGSL